MSIWKLIPEDAELVSLIQTKTTRTEITFMVPGEDEMAEETDDHG